MFTNNLGILLQAANGGAAWGQLLIFGGIFVIFYFFMIRPQQQKQKEQKKFVDAVQQGDEVVTIGGLHGKVLSVDELTVTLEVDKGVRMKFEKTAISMETSKDLKNRKKA